MERKRNLFPCGGFTPWRRLPFWIGVRVGKAMTSGAAQLNSQAVEIMISGSSMRLHPNGLAVASYRYQTLNYRRFLLRKTVLLAVMSAFFFLACFAQAQQADAMFGFGTVVSPGAAACGSASFVNF